MKIEDEIIISDPKGKVKDIIIRGHSLTKGFAQYMNMCGFSQIGLVIYDMLTNNPAFVTAAASAFITQTTNNTTNQQSIILGLNDTTPESVDNVTMDNRIVAGSGTNQLIHAISVPITTYKLGSDWVCEVQRQFTNSSGADITVKELGLTVAENGYGAGAFQMLIARIVSTFIIPNTEARNITWRIKVTG
jgi:hypothetical protein